MKKGIKPFLGTRDRPPKKKKERETPVTRKRREKDEHLVPHGGPKIRNSRGGGGIWGRVELHGVKPHPSETVLKGAIPRRGRE